MGALSMLLRDPTALPYLLQVKVATRAALRGKRAWRRSARG